MWITRRSRPAKRRGAPPKGVPPATPAPPPPDQKAPKGGQNGPPRGGDVPSPCPPFGCPVDPLGAPYGPPPAILAGSPSPICSAGRRGGSKNRRFVLKTRSRLAEEGRTPPDSSPGLFVPSERQRPNLGRRHVGAGSVRAVATFALSLLSWRACSFPSMSWLFSSLFGVNIQPEQSPVVLARQR